MRYRLTCVSPLALTWAARLLLEGVPVMIREALAMLATHWIGGVLVA